MLFGLLWVNIVSMMDEETLQFIKEREEKLGGAMLWRSYATWFAEIGRERRDFGVFAYSDGKTLILEDFFRPATLLGYELETKREKERRKEYRKMEIHIPISTITSLTLVTKNRAEKALRNITKEIKEASVLERILFRTVARVEADGRVFLLELPDYKEFKRQLESYKTIGVTQ